MRHILTFVFSFLAAFSFGQTFSYPSIKSNGSALSDFIPEGWAMLDSASGDLNKDGSQDVAIVLQHKDSISMLNNTEDTILTQPRILMILFKNGSESDYSLIEQSNSFILKHDNAAMDDPYEGLKIDSGVLEIRFRLFYNMGSWYVTNAVYKFRYQKGQFVLIGADNSSFHRATHDFENYSYNFLTKKRTLEKGNDDNRSKKTTRKTISGSPLKTLKTFSEPFTWEVEKDVYL